MANYQRMTKAELIPALRGLEAQVASLESIAAERDRLSHELSVHQIELEAQNQELREAQRLVEESRDRYTDLYDFAPVGYVALDAGGHIQEINLTGASMLGVERSRLIGIPFSLYVARGDAGTFREHLRQSGQSQEPVTGELQVVVKEAQAIRVQMVSLALRDGGGGISRYRITMRDVTAHRRAEQALRESEERFRAIFEQAAVGVSQCVSHTGEYVRVNRKYCEIAGYAREELLTWRFQGITHPDDLEAELNLMQQLMEGKIRTFAMEKRLRRKDGEIVWVNLTVSSMWASGEEPTYHIAIIEDITERRQAIEDTKLRLAELEPVSEISTTLRAARTLGEMLPMLLDLTLEALHAMEGSIWLYDSVEDVLRPAASRGESERDGTWSHPLKPGEGIVGAAFATGQPHLAGDFRLDQGASEAMCQRIPPGIGGAAIPIRAGEKVIGTFVINVSLPRKLTPSEVHLLTTLSELAGTAIQRIMLREEVERRAAELEKRVIQRTAELSQREAALEAANAKLTELDRMKSQFVSNVSHELRTPITTIKLYASLLRRGPPERRDQFLDALEQEANRQAHLIEEILQVSRIDSGRLDLHYAPYALNDLAEASVVSREPLAAEKGVTLACKPLKPGPTVSVDRVRTLQVIDNLVENALWYTPTGGQVSVATGTAEADGQIWATLSVTDTGMGIPKDELPRIFERFFRGEQPREMQLPGTGLGLAIVKDIVDLHGWRVTVESQVGGGSTFTVWIPLA